MPWLFLLLSFAGFSDSFYLSWEKYRGGQVICAVTSGCDKVLSSAYSVIGGVPVAYLGVIYYLTIFFLVLQYFITKKGNYLNLAAGITLIGFLASLWFLFLQSFIIKAYCIYCLTSAAISILLFVIGFYYLFRIASERSKKLTE